MDEQETLAARFEQHRAQLRALAFRMLGSLSEADDAVQDAWLRLSRADISGVDDLAAWLRTVVSRLCLDMLRARSARRDQVVAPELAGQSQEGEPEQETVLIDEVGRALLVVLDRLSPAERVAFVLHDVFAVPFAQIAPIVERTPGSAKKLASRARQRVRGAAVTPPADLVAQRRAVDAFLAAARGGDFAALLAVLAPDVVRRADRAALPPGGLTVIRGAKAVAEQTLVLGLRARFAEPALVNGAVGVVVAPRGQLQIVLSFAVMEGRIVAYEVIAEPERLQRLGLAVISTEGGQPAA